MVLPAHGTEVLGVGQDHGIRPADFIIWQSDFRRKHGGRLFMVTLGGRYGDAC